MNWQISDEAIFVGMVFIATFLLMQSFIVPAFGENRRARQRLRKRLRSVADAADSRNPVSLLHNKRLAQLSPLERSLRSLPGMAGLSQLIEQAGRDTLAHRFVLKSLAIGVVAGLLVNVWWSGALAVAAGLAAGALPYLGLVRARAGRLSTFEEQLPEALVIMSRALRAGHPFADALSLVGQEMPAPIGPEFQKAFMEINYGGELRSAMNGLLARIGSVTVMVFVTSVLIQKETGGNLAELLENLAAIIRERFRFHRKLRTLSAQGRLAAWILSLLPFFMAAILSAVNPAFLPMLIDNPVGRQIVVIAFLQTVAGILWMRRIVRVDV